MLSSRQPTAYADTSALLAVAYLRGADLWHIATALYVKDTVVGEMTFVTLDNRQRAVAANLGFAT